MRICIPSFQMLKYKKPNLSCAKLASVRLFPRDGLMIKGYSNLISKIVMCIEYVVGTSPEKILNCPQCFRGVLIRSTAFIFAFYRPHNSYYETIFEKIYLVNVSEEMSRQNIYGDFNIHNVAWLAHSNKTDTDDEERYCLLAFFFSCSIIDIFSQRYSQSWKRYKANVNAVL